MDILQPRKISGFADYNEAENAALSGWLQVIEQTFRLYGFSRLTVRPLELRDVLLSRGGIQKQIFGITRLPEDNVTDLALPFDRTVPLANWIALNENDIVFPYKRYEVSYSFRGERPQAGRFQGFLQADVDIIGREQLDLNADAETIAVIFQTLSNIKAGHISLFINHTGLLNKIISSFNIKNELRPEVLRNIDKLKKIGKEKVIKELENLVSISPDQLELMGNLFSYQGTLENFKNVYPAQSKIAEHDFEELEFVWNSLKSSGIPPEKLVFAPGIARGLDYYTGVVFETFLDELESIGSIASGGRYNDLASTFTKSRLPGVGGSVGVTRLFDALCRNNKLPLTKKTEADVFVGFRNSDLRSAAQSAAVTLRNAEINTDLYSGKSNIKKQLSYCDRRGITYAVIAMEENVFLVKNLDTGEQLDVSSAEQMLRHIQSWL